MVDRPILFSWPMVKALLGTKTQTRRLLTRNNTTVNGESWRGKTCPWQGLRLDESMVRDTSPLSGQRDPHLAVPFCHPNDEPAPSDECGIYTVRPVVEIGDRLWVREAWSAQEVFDDLSPAEIGEEFATEHGEPWCPVFFEADQRCDGSSVEMWQQSPPGRLRAGMHMPRWASRLTLTVTDVRVQRLREISVGDAAAEGLKYLDEGPGAGFWIVDDTPVCGDGSVEAYAQLWDEINGAGSWEANPWVVALTFTVERRNIDALPARAAP